MKSDSHSTSAEPEYELLVQLADNTLSGPARAEAEAFVAMSAEAQQQLARQRRVTTMLRNGGPRVSERAAAELANMLAPRKRRTVRLPMISLIPVRALAVGAAAAAIALVLSFSGSGSHDSGPIINQTAQLVYRTPTAAAPTRHAVHPALLNVSFAGITLPDYEAGFGARATGTRSDLIGGHKLLTVFYRLPTGATMSYSILAGRSLPLPNSTKLVLFKGVEIHGVANSGLSVVTLIRHGRTCVLAAHTTIRTLVALAEAPLRPTRSA